MCVCVWVWVYIHTCSLKCMSLERETLRERERERETESPRTHPYSVSLSQRHADIVPHKASQQALEESVKVIGVRRPPMKVSLMEAPILDPEMHGPWQVPPTLVRHLYIHTHIHKYTHRYIHTYIHTFGPRDARALASPSHTGEALIHTYTHT